MNNLQTQQKNYLEYCQYQKRLDAKTIKAYRIDLTQFIQQIPTDTISAITPNILEAFIAKLHQTYLPKTIPLPTIEIFLSTIYKQRKIAQTSYQRKNALQDAAVIELLFANQPSGGRRGYTVYSGNAGA